MFIDKQRMAELGTEPLSTEPYLSENYFSLEKERIFRRSWLYVGRVEEFDRPGAYLVRAFEPAGASVLVARGQDDEIRAFHNVCSHRHAKLVWDDRGQARNFTCKYHGWGFGLDGALRNVPDADSFFDLDLKACGLSTISCETWRGFIFINFAAEPDETLEQFMAPIAEKLGDHGFAGCSSHVMLSAEVDVNWKAMLDNFQETYHLGFIHQRTVGDRGCAEGNPFGHPMSFDFFGRHRHMSIWGNPGHKPAPIEALAGSFGGVSGAGATQQTEHYSKIRPANWQLDVHGIFPNLLIEVAPTFFYTIEVMPVSVSRTRWTARMFLPPAENAGQRFAREYNIAAFRDTVAEDIAVLRTLQASMASHAKPVIQFQAHEVLCRHTYEMIDRAIADPIAAE